MNNKAVAIVGGGDQSNRKELDHYPTPKEATKALMNFLHNDLTFYFTKDECKRIWEPACGEGFISEVIKKYGHNVYSSDVKTDYGNVLDFFEHSFPKDPKRGIFDAVITNPPFNLAEQFITESLKVAPIVCMLLKTQYWHAKSRYELFMKSKPAYILPLTWRPDFMEHTRINGEKGSPTMDVSWVVWIGKSDFCQYKPLLKPLKKAD